MTKGRRVSAPIFHRDILPLSQKESYALRLSLSFCAIAHTLSVSAIGARSRSTSIEK